MHKSSILCSKSVSNYSCQYIRLESQKKINSTPQGMLATIIYENRVTVLGKGPMSKFPNETRVFQ